MNSEKYRELMLRFAKELHDVGVTDDMLVAVKDQCDRHQNAASTSSDAITDRFVYRHDGYMIEAVRSVKLIAKKCSN